jgi:hypothetical protein
MRCLFLIICVSLSFVGYGQKLKVGFRAGVNFSNFYGHYLQGEAPNYSPEPVDPNSPPIIIGPSANYPKPRYYYETDFIDDARVGFFSYLFLDFELKERLSIEGGLGYSQRGINLNYSQHSTSINPDNTTTEQSYQFKRNLRLDYIVVPVTFQYTIGKYQQFYVLGGFYNSFAVNFLIKNSLVTVNNKTYNSSGQEIAETKSILVDDKTYAKIIDSGLIGGFGVNVPLSKKMMIGLDVRSMIGVIGVAGKYEKHGFQSFSENAKNISFETGLKLHYVLK